MNTETNHQVIFHTNGIMDPLSWEVIGMSAKETDSAIGQFGSGLKYAIAILLRTGHEIAIHSGGNVYNFDTETKYFREKEFQIVRCNGKTLGMTTDMGKHWELWMAYRELVSNTMDEGGLHFSGEPMVDGTSIVVKGKDFHDILPFHDMYFLNDREPIAKCCGVNIYKGTGKLFYRGVRVGEIEKSSYDYEICNLLKLTEDRTILDKRTAEHEIIFYICNSCENRDVIKQLITAKKDTWEYAQQWSYNWSTTFQSVVEEVWKTNPSSLNPKISAHYRKISKMVEWDTREFTENEQRKLTKTLEMLALFGYPVTRPIQCIVDDSLAKIGFEFNNIIYLAPRAFTHGIYELLGTLFQQHINEKGYENIWDERTVPFLSGELLNAKLAQHKIDL